MTSAISTVILLSLSIGIALAGLYVEKITDGKLRKFDQCQTGIYTGYTLQLLNSNDSPNDHNDLYHPHYPRVLEVLER